MRLRTWNTTPEWDSNSLTLIGYVISKGWGWLVGEHVELLGQAPHCIEQVRSVPNCIMGWLPPKLCANTTLANFSKV